MELLYTPKAELARLLRENMVTVEEVVFLFYSNKLNALDFRSNAPGIYDKLLKTYLKNSRPLIGDMAQAAHVTA